MYSVGIIVASDTRSTGKNVDLSASLIKELVEEKNFKVMEEKIIPDEKLVIIEELKRMSDDKKIDLILTTGGTGLSPRDVTPEATKEVLTREVPGVAEGIRAYSLTITPRAMLSRGTSGLRNNSLIVNLPGSPKAIKEILDYSLDTLIHGLDTLNLNTSECSR